MEPARSVIELLGGEKVVSRITGTAYTAPYRWQQPREKGGTDGTIPQRHHNVLLAYAKSKGIPLTAEKLLPCQPATASALSHAPALDTAANLPADFAGEGAHG